jgi:hypothetical protein
LNIAVVADRGEIAGPEITVDKAAAVWLGSSR